MIADIPSRETRQSSANDNVVDQATPWAGDVLRIKVKIEDKRRAVALYGAQTVEALQDHIEKWPAEQFPVDPAGRGGMPSIRVVILAEDEEIEEIPIRDSLIQTEFAKLIYGMGLIASLILWGLIISSFWAHS